MTVIRTWWIGLLGVLTISACTSIPVRVHESGVRIEPVSNDTGLIRSAAFWRDRDGLSLRGEAAANSDNKILVAGHIDVSIRLPDQSKAVCTTAEWDADSKQIFIPFSLRFEALPPRGTRLRVWHHPATAHDDCVS